MLEHGLQRCLAQVDEVAEMMRHNNHFDKRHHGFRVVVKIVADICISCSSGGIYSHRLVVKKCVVKACEVANFSEIPFSEP